MQQQAVPEQRAAPSWTTQVLASSAGSSAAAWSGGLALPELPPLGEFGAPQQTHAGTSPRDEVRKVLFLFI